MLEPRRRNGEIKKLEWGKVAKRVLRARREGKRQTRGTGHIQGSGGGLAGSGGEGRPPDTRARRMPHPPCRSQPSQLKDSRRGVETHPLLPPGPQLLNARSYLSQKKKKRQHSADLEPSSSDSQEHRATPDCGLLCACVCVRERAPATQ